MLRIAICDDEEYFLMFEKKMISDYMEARDFNYQILSFTSGRELLKAMDGITGFDMIFLDIGMADLNGMETARRIRKLTKDTYLVFVTVYITYALKGYEVNAVRFIIKDSRIFDSAMKECMDTIIYEMNYKEKRQDFNFREGNIALALEDIMYVESVAHKLYFRVIQDSALLTFTMYEKLDVMEEMLQDAAFCRIHKSYLVNLKYVKRLERDGVLLRNGTRLSIARSRNKEVGEAVIGYWGRI